MTRAPEPISELLPDLLDLDALLRGVPPLLTPGDWAEPQLFPDQAEFDEFLAWVRRTRDQDLP
ncbi:MAG: hypothetical protein FWD74_06700 [Actinomycetia bacterium]|nr:hypothetical protein [Actinomycetes bacterium]